MNSKRKPAIVREKELRLALFRIEQGRAHTKATDVSFSAVAREAGVSPALIHNHYPEFAALIRAKQGKSTRARLDANKKDLDEERRKLREMTAERDDAHLQIAKLASLNEMLIVDNQTLRALLASNNVTQLPARRPG